MLQIPTWSKVLTVLILAFGILIALPNALPGWVVAKMPRFLPTGQVALGLDLQGGSYLLLEVEFDQVQKDRLESLMGDVRTSFRKARIGYTGLEAGADQYPFASSIRPDTRTKDDPQRIESRHGRFGASVGARDYELGEPGRNSFVMKMTDNFKTRTQGQILEESIEVVASESTSWARASRRSRGRARTASWCRFRA